MVTRLADLVYHWASVAGHREAIVAGPDRVTYDMLAREVTRVAEALRRAGLRPGARVAYHGCPGAGFLVSALATHIAGGVWLGLNPRYTAAELAHVIADAAPSLIICEGATAPEPVIEAVIATGTRSPLQRVTSLDDLAAVPNSLPASNMALPPEVALLVYTSGTTGIPKGAMLTHRGTVAAARLYGDRYEHDALRTLLNLPINHVGALIDLVSPALFCGGTLVTMTSFEPERIPEVLRRERISILGQVPAMHLAIDAACPYEPEDLPDLRHLVWSGAAMPLSWIAARHGRRVQLSTCYGLTECTGSVTFTDPSASIETLARTVGRPAGPEFVRIATPEGRPLPAGEPGEVQVCGPLVMAGYLNRAEASAEALTADNWLRTGDLAVLNEDGTVTLAGRSKEMFKSGGYNVYPREVEQVLEDHPSVAAAAVLGMPDDRWQEVGWAFVLLRGATSADELAGFARGRLANYKIPKRIILASELPLLPIGKIDKQALRAAAQEGLYG
jgi:acyl-CoA synthetase (AMP-forming)/AMP-acid ligase II